VRSSFAVEMIFAIPVEVFQVAPAVAAPVTVQRRGGKKLLRGISCLCAFCRAGSGAACATGVKITKNITKLSANLIKVHNRS
jgi:hypothetical protein